MAGTLILSALPRSTRMRNLSADRAAAKAAVVRWAGDGSDTSARADVQGRTLENRPAMAAAHRTQTPSTAMTNTAASRTQRQRVQACGPIDGSG